MNVLIIGAGGRENALAYKVAQSKSVSKLYCAPGNAGIAVYAECIDIGILEFDRLVEFAKRKAIDLTIIGMDLSIAAGIVDVFEAAGLRVFGPSLKASILETSKVYAKEFMKRHNIPTGSYRVFDQEETAKKYLEEAAYPVVVKADGMALGKGVLICNTPEEGYKAVDTLMVQKKYGDAGNQIIIEEFLTGNEVSMLSFVDGNTIKMMTSAQDYKKVGDGNKGVNTSGMGAISPSPHYTDEIHDLCMERIYTVTTQAMKSEGRPFKGVLFFGLILTETGPKVLEYNVRLGDPEAQVVLTRMENDIIQVIDACIDETLDEVELAFEEACTACVILASGGYPDNFNTGYLVTGLDTFDNERDCNLFHAGTTKTDEGIITRSGRVVGVTYKRPTIKEAREAAYKGAQKIHYTHKYMRRDIGR